MQKVKKYIEEKRELLPMLTAGARCHRRDPVGLTDWRTSWFGLPGALTGYRRSIKWRVFQLLN